MAKSKRKLKKIKRYLFSAEKMKFSSSYNNNRKSDMLKRLLYIACLLGAAAVIIGAFGAHILKEILTDAELQTYKTGVEYHFYHTFAIISTAIISRYTSKRWTTVAGLLFLGGIICFSGSLYLLSVSSRFGLESLKPLLGPMTPLGGLLFIGGWISLFIAATSYKRRSSSYRSHRKAESSTT